ncbi:calcium-binding and coiled-coil domain-containing protein 1b [Lampris incognitus]|uniref:calcium-binding and coiled-coil domain-containing protein 1b n=1 Tax=Lampris incognitus TaxID=2546036 RepID=UPI0024B4DB76|nr:calcium-binding and coiled-coil domain-containing protein 1b [Lampris incognitus]
MEKQAKVVFRNVGQFYFPQTRVECHYSLTPHHLWSRSDWIGLFQVGWSSVKEYYTYTWALGPEDYTGGTSVNCCALFHASYLPHPSTVEYQFVYVDEKGEVCTCSRPFTFCSPKPLEELETMKEEQGEEEQEDEEEELILVIPRAQLLQGRLEECLKEQDSLRKALEMAKDEKETERQRSEEVRQRWEQERQALHKEISELRENLRQNWEKLKWMEGRNKDVKYSQESLSSELSNLLAEKSSSQQRIKELEEDVRVLTNREEETTYELERMKDRGNKMSSQMKHEEERRKNLQGDYETALADVRRLQERLEASERIAESLRRELSELGVQQAHGHAELHQARLQVAQLTLQLSEEDLAHSEGRAKWAQEREAYKQTAETHKKKVQELSWEVQRQEDWLKEERMEREKLEVELARERDCNRVQLSDAKREVQELKANLRSAQQEQGQQQLEKQELHHYIGQLEQRLEAVSGSESSGTAGDASSEDGWPASRAVLSALVLSSHPDRCNSQTHCLQGRADGPMSHTQDETGTQREPRVAEGKPLILPELLDPVLSDLADSPLW